MGKSQKKRSMRRHNPMRVPDSHLAKGLASASASSSKGEAILPIIQKLDSVDTADRKWACVAVSNLIHNDPSTRRLLQSKNIVGALITRLSDSEEEVVVEAAGSLRNLCIDGGFDICAEMFNKNILAPLKTFIPKISSTLSQYLASPKNAPENAQKLVYEFADNVITILWCLSETSNKALNAINQISLVPFLMSFLASRGQLPISTTTSAAQCLYVLTDENPSIINEVRTNAEYTTCLLGVVRSEDTAPKSNGKEKDNSDPRASAFRVLCCGILRNVSPIPPPSIAATVDLDRDVIIPNLEPVLTSIDLQEASQAAHHALENQEPIPQVENLSPKNAPKSDHKTPSELELERLETRLRTVQLALEILTGMCATLPDPEIFNGAGNDEEGLQDGNQDDEGMDDAQDIDMDESTSTPAAPPPAFFTTLVTSLLKLIQPTPLSLPPVEAPSPHPPTTSVLGAIHVSALECLNNIFLSMATSLSGRPSGLAAENGSAVFDAVWSALGAVGTDISGPGQERRRDVWETGVGVLWGVGNVWKGALAPTAEQVQVLIQYCNASTDIGVRVKAIGTLECLAQHPQSIEANKTISSFLLSLLPPSATPPTATEPLLQAASALIDIYSDETLPYDTNFRQGHYLDALVRSTEGIRRAVRGIDRKKERELRVRGEEVRDNLVAFIQYRRGLRL
ncbi:ARM repeat-containing protein [Epithele typhae]|uniref:ARM repeat-containing protein n=1 Tax=Epithele typhae TaxID=378194 RepID=UPI00200838DA|nr:ARM repeat-containing protein [Epithele typhae]KAH9932085.1 ARM repeat-containing protein [Epithele typhae]